jgi:hypothetical protein
MLSSFHQDSQAVAHKLIAYSKCKGSGIESTLELKFGKSCSPTLSKIKNLGLIYPSSKASSKKAPSENTLGSIGVKPLLPKFVVLISYSTRGIKSMPF